MSTEAAIDTTKEFNEDEEVDRIAVNVDDTIEDDDEAEAYEDATSGKTMKTMD